MLMEFVWHYEVFSKTRGYHKSMGLLVFHICTYLCTCAWVWLGSKLYARRGCVALWAQAFHIWLGLFSCKNVCGGPGLLHLGPTFSHIKRGQVWPLKLGPGIFPKIRGHVSWSQALGFLIGGLVISGNSYMGPAQPSPAFFNTCIGWSMPLGLGSGFLDTGMGQ